MPPKLGVGACKRVDRLAIEIFVMPEPKDAARLSDAGVRAFPAFLLLLETLKGVRATTGALLNTSAASVLPVTVI